MISLMVYHELIMIGISPYADFAYFVVYYVIVNL